MVLLTKADRSRKNSVMEETASVITDEIDRHVPGIGGPPRRRQSRSPRPSPAYHGGAMKPDWTDLGSLDDLPEGALVLRKDAGGRRYACVRQGDVVHALDDRCPHQGYP